MELLCNILKSFWLSQEHYFNNDYYQNLKTNKITAIFDYESFFIFKILVIIIQIGTAKSINMYIKAKKPYIKTF